jgi:RNA-directed DNA polymerase
MVDRAMQALYRQALEPIAETLGDPHSSGFRKERSTTEAIEQGFTVLNKRKSPKWVLEGDIQACLDHACCCLLQILTVADIRHA